MLQPDETGSAELMAHADGALYATITTSRERLVAADWQHRVQYAVKVLGTHVVSFSSDLHAYVHSESPRSRNAG